ncbi:MAG: type II toxin-antitoxin system prevent-host-death family antitoxin [Desulforhopalus sp.]
MPRNDIAYLRHILDARNRIEECLHEAPLPLQACMSNRRRPVIITQNGEPRAVLQDPQSYENMRNAIGILKLISEGETDIREGRAKPQDEVFDEIEKALKANRR